MSKKSKTITILTTLIASVFIFLIGWHKNYQDVAREVYQIYLDGEKIGLIDNQEELYALINQEQSSIKETYNVDQVYPPNGFSIAKYITYDDDITTVDDIYNKIKDSKDFTIKGYTITVMSAGNDTEDAKTLFRINVLDKQVFEDAINKVIKSFISEEEYNNYINNKQAEIEGTGQKILNIYFKENISIKETYISTEEKIYTDVDELSKFLLFGENAKYEEYTVKPGDTIASIADANELNVSEFLVANSQYKDENDLLGEGDQVIISLINPQLTLVYDVYKVEDVTIKYETETTYDYDKLTSYKKIERAGVNGIQRVATTTQIINGDANQGAVVDTANSYVIKNMVTEKVVRGKKTTSGNIGYWVDDGSEWAWPTNYPYTISSPFGKRYLFNRTAHEGVDITGTGLGSPIYSIGDGEVIASGRGVAGSSGGIAIIIRHPNGLYSMYAHLNSTLVSAGDQVSRKQKIGTMGNTGQVTGTHLHISISMGKPYSIEGYKWLDPLTVLK